MKRKLSLLLCLIMIVSMVAGCTQEVEIQPPATDNPDTPAETTLKAMMAPGTYTAEAYGFSMSWPDIISVTVSENEIESISFDEESGSTASMVDSVAAAMFP